MFGHWCADGEACGVCPWCKKRKATAFRLCVALFIFVASFILLLHVSHAAVPDQTVSSAGQSSYQYFQTLSNTNGDISGSISGVTLRGQGYNNNILSNGVIVEICSDATCGTILATDTQTWGYNWIGAPNVVEAHFTWDTIAIPANSAGMCMRVTTDSGGDSFYNMHYEGSGTDSDYPFGSGSAASCGGSIPSLKDLYMVWDTPPPPSAEIVYPADSSLVFDPNFNWIITASTSTGSIGIFYGTTTSSPEYFDGYFSVINGTSSYPKGTPLFNGTYYAWVALYAATEAGEQIATSSVISFQIGFGGGSSGGGTSGDWSLSTSTLCADIQPFATATYIGQFSNAVLDGSCKALVFAFFPSTSSVQEIVDIKDLVFDKPPIGYFSAISDAIDLSTTTAAFSFPTTTVAALQTVVIDPFDTYFPLVVGLTTGIWIFKRFANKDKL